jgi:RNA polymerase sigma factor (sigma-70 family)
MPTPGPRLTNLVIAAQGGDRRARDELAAASLPLVYAVVRRAMGEHPDVDDVVQDTMVRALRELGALRSPESFRQWLMAIAVNQVGTALHRRDVAAERTTALDTATAMPDPGAAYEDVTILRRDLAAQRRQLARAARWLAPEERALLSLWWLETAGEISRAELAQALGTSIPHAAVRIQRMRQHLESSRALVAALEGRARCAGLSRLVPGWDGRASSVWRKRFSRHLRSCPVCGPAADLVPAERLFVGFGLLTVPFPLTAAVIAKAAAGATHGAAGSVLKAGALGHLATVMVSHPVASLVAVGALAVGVAVPTAALPVLGPGITGVGTAPGQARRGGVPGPSPSAARALPTGPVSLEYAGERGRYITLAGTFGVLAPAGPDSDATTRRRATFSVVPGLSDPRCVSLRAADGTYLRHASWRLRQSPDEGTVLFRGDATFCVRSGSADGSISLESANYPGYFLRRVRQELWVDRTDGSASFRADSAFVVRPALA